MRRLGRLRQGVCTQGVAGGVTIADKPIRPLPLPIVFYICLIICGRSDLVSPGSFPLQGVAGGVRIVDKLKKMLNDRKAASS